MIGMIARANNRGLGIQTWEIARHLQPDVTVVIEEQTDKFGWFPERFPGAILSPWAGYMGDLSDEAIDALLECDTIFTVETTYDPKLFPLAQANARKTVIYVNPEFYREHEVESASEVWVPTTWRIDQIPRAKVVTMPVALDRFQQEPGDGFLFVGGHAARADRNGFEIAIRSARRAGVPLTVISQDPLRQMDRGVTVSPSVENYWDLYRGMGVLVMPRKYGGLSLPVQEAMAAGMAVVMGDCSPNSDWPIALVRGVHTQRMQTPGGQIIMFVADVAAVADMLEKLSDPDYRSDWQDMSRQWAQENSWETRLPTWQALLATS